MKDSVHTFCDDCMHAVDASTQEFYETQPIRGLELDVVFEWPVCPDCGKKITVGSYANKNYARLYDAYRKATGLPNGDEIRAMREKLGLSQKKLADLLGIGVASIQRYEGGSLPTEAHASMIRQLNDPVFLRQRLLDTSFGSAKERDALVASVEQKITREEEDASLSRKVFLMVQRVPDEHTGNIAFSVERFREILAYLALNIHDLYRTKLNKALFYLDYSAYRDLGHGITGLRYAKADYGPVPDKYEQLIAAFANEDAFYFSEQEDGGQIFCTRQEEVQQWVFSPEEREQLSKVAEFVNSFDTATALTKASHEEPVWIQADWGEILSYRGAHTLKGI
ncbi:MAG: DUF4065 domain-containing protein [Eggerthellaceae bacterium]|nr:DUF4065 domain-containing protein [Eggerthellaceae bacterium]